VDEQQGIGEPVELLPKMTGSQDSHGQDHAQRLADRIGTDRDGRIAAQYAPDKNRPEENARPGPGPPEQHETQGDAVGEPGERKEILIQACADHVLRVQEHGGGWQDVSDEKQQRRRPR
jgi:hypothetical protein